MGPSDSKGSIGNKQMNREWGGGHSPPHPWPLKTSSLLSCDEPNQSQNRTKKQKKNKKERKKDTAKVVFMFKI